MRIFYDTEFIDDGKTIELISIGMIAENGEEFYRINSDLSLEHLPRASDGWHMDNTVPSLPMCPTSDDQIEWVQDHPDTKWVMPRDAIRADVYEFILRHTPIGGQVELWAWYGAYDHVALAQLWGPMAKLPRIVPMYTNDLKQEMTRLEKVTGNNRLHFIMPTHRSIGSSVAHNALDDARLLKIRYEWLEQFNSGLSSNTCLTETNMSDAIQ